MPVEFPQNSVVGQQRQQISELQFDKFPNPQSFLVWKIRFENLPALIFGRKQCYGSMKWRWLTHWKNWNLGDPFLYNFHKIWDGGREDCFLWTRSSRIANSRRRSVSRNRKPRKRTGFYEEDRSPSWSLTTLERLALMTQFLIMQSYSLSLFMMTTFRNLIRGGTKFYYPCQRFTPMMFWKVCTNWEYVSLINSKPYWNCTTWNSSENIDAQLSKFEDTGEEENRSETSIAQFWRPTWENWNRSSGQESKGNEWRWRRKRYLLPVERKRASARKETNAVSGMRVTTVHKNQTTMPPHHLSHPCHEVEVCGGKDVSEAKVTVVPFFDNRADVIWRVLTRERLVNIGILPSVNFTNRNGLQSRDTCLFVPASQRLMNNQTKSQRKATIPTNEEKATTRML